MEWYDSSVLGYGDILVDRTPSFEYTLNEHFMLEIMSHLEWDAGKLS